MKSALMLLVCLKFAAVAYSQDSLSVVKPDTISVVAKKEKDSVSHNEINRLYKNNNFDTIWVSKLNRTVKIYVDKSSDTPTSNIGNKDFASSILGCCSIILKAMKVQGTPSSLYITYGEKYYNGTIAYKEEIHRDDEVIDWRTKPELAGPTNETKAITVNTPSLESQMAIRRIGVLEGKEKDRFKDIADVKERMAFKLAEVMQDDSYLYIKLGIYNNSKTDYSIELVDFLFRNTGNTGDYKRVQEDEKIDNGVNSVPSKEFKSLVFAFPKFSIASSWELFVVLREKNGGRKFELAIPYKIINDALKF